MKKINKFYFIPVLVLLCAVFVFMPKDAKAAVKATQTGLYVDKVVVTYTPASDEEVLNYTVYVKKNEGNWVKNQTLGGGAQTATISGLKPTDSYISIKAEYKYKYKSGSGTVYNGTASLYEVKMLPSKVTGLKQERWYYYIKQIDAKWNRQYSITGYQAEFYGPKAKQVKRKKITNTYACYNTYKVKNGKTYKMRVRGYTEFNGKTYWGAWSNYTYFVGQTPNIKAKFNKKKMTVKWNKVSGATSYTIMVSTKSGKGYKAVKTVSAKKKKAVIKKFGKKKFKKGKKYYVYVRSNKKVGKKTFHSNNGQPLYYLPIKCK